MPFRTTFGIVIVALWVVSIVGATDVGAQTGPLIETTIAGTGAGPMVLDERRNLVYVYACYTEGVAGIEVRERSLATRVDRVGTFCGDYPYSSAMDASADHIYLVDGTCCLEVVDLSTRLRSNVQPYGYPFSGVGKIALNPSTGLLYETAWYDYFGRVGLIALDPSKSAADPGRTLTVPIMWDKGVYGDIAANPNTNLIYFASTCVGLGVAVIDGTPGSPTFHTVTASLSLPIPQTNDVFTCQFGGTVAVNRHTNKVYVVAQQTLHVIDGNPASPTFNSFVAHIPLPLEHSAELAFSLAVNPVTGRVYVKSYRYLPWVFESEYRTHLTTVDESSLSVVSSIELPGKLWGWVMVDASQNRIVVNDVWSPTANGPGTTTILSDPVTQSSSVPAGAGAVTVSSTAATMTFSEVASPGSVTLAPIEPSELPLALPGQFSIEGGLSYDVSTTAGISGPITLCFNVSHVTDPTLFATLRVLHGEGGNWVDRTTSREYSTGTICALAASLSPFVVGHLDVTYQVRELYDATRAVKAGSTIPLKIQLFAPWGANLSAQDVVVSATGLKKMSDTASFAVQDAGQSNADNNFRFDSSVGPGGGYIYNLQTKGLTTGTYEIEFSATGDRTIHKLRFQVR